MSVDPSGERRVPITPQLAVRVAGLGIVALVLFGVVFFRLWYLQVLDSDKYLAEARQNRVRTERIPAPRGDIVDAAGTVLVSNRAANVVTLNPRTIPVELRTAISEWGAAVNRWAAAPKKKRGPRPRMPQATGATWDLYRRLGRVLLLSPKTINRRVVSAIVQVPYADVRIKVDATEAETNYLVERKEIFSGVAVPKVFLRKYPGKSVGAHLLGTVSPITSKQLGYSHFAGIKGGTDVGQSGLEYQYEKYLRGIEGRHSIDVNAQGERLASSRSQPPRQGRSLKLTLDLALQQYAEKELLAVGGGLPGAFVAMNPRTGAIYAMGSYPTFDARALRGPFATKAAYDRRFGSEAGSPLFPRADESNYPTGSIFKPITALAALTTGTTTAGETYVDTGCIKIGKLDSDTSCNAKKEPNGPVDMVSALKVSSDTYFYRQALKLNQIPGQPLQQWARKLGLGRRTGIDLPFENPGTVPDSAWRKRLNQLEASCRSKKHHPCGYADGTNRPWTAGDEVHLSVGQGDLQATPLQMAIMYSAIANGGRVPTPHLGAEIFDDRGLVQKIDPKRARHVNIPAAAQRTVMDGLFAAANEPKGTSTKVWNDGWPRGRHPIFGKTGTAQRFYGPYQEEIDQAWYAAYSYDRSPERNPIVVITTIEKGGFGASSAAPLARLILSKYFHVKPKLVRGDSDTL